MTLERNVPPELPTRIMTTRSTPDNLKGQDVPIYSKHTPTTLNVLTNSDDFEFGNR